MPRKILVIPDKFKGTLTAAGVANAIARGWQRARPADELELLPMSDGGDGFGEVMSDLLGGTTQLVETVDAAHRPVEARWWWVAATRTAIVESAQVIGLALLPPGKFHPFELDTYGLGAVFQAAAAKGARRCLVGIGGSATNDGGFALARSLDWRFGGSHDALLERWTELSDLTHLIPPAQPALFDELVVAVDVQNPLLGKAGCTRIYGPQKGLKPEDFEFAERCLAQLAGVVGKQLDLNCAEEPGAGAAGGLGFGLRCFLAAQLSPGFGVFAQHAALSERLKSAQLVLTGEGRLDEQTLMGKGVGELAQLCRQHDVPCIALAGTVSGGANSGDLFDNIHSLTPVFASREQAYQDAARWLERLAEHAARQWPDAAKA